MSDEPVNTTSSSIAPVELANTPMGPFTLRLRRSSKREDVLKLIPTQNVLIEAICTPTATSAAVIEELQTICARFGLPETIITDNGTCFASAEFESFLQSNGIKHFTSAPYHPASNGLAERAVQIVKKGLRKVTTGSIRNRLAKILMTYRITPQTTTGISPAELLLGKRPRTRLDLLKPNTAERVENKQAKQVQQHKAKNRNFEVNDSVFVRNYHNGDRWLPGVIQKRTGPVSFLVDYQMVENEGVTKIKYESALWR